MNKFILISILLAGCGESPTQSVMNNYCANNGWVKEDWSVINELNNALDECMIVTKMAVTELNNCRRY